MANSTRVRSRAPTALLAIFVPLSILLLTWIGSSSSLSPSTPVSSRFFARNVESSPGVERSVNVETGTGVIAANEPPRNSTGLTDTVQWDNYTLWIEGQRVFLQ